MKTLAMIVVLSLTGVGSVLAQEAGDSAQYKSKTVYDFDDDNVEVPRGEPGEIVRLTYRELHAQVCRFANVLLGQGIVAVAPDRGR